MARRRPPGAGTWRIGGVADYWSKLELGWHVSTTANHRDAIETVEQAIAESERLTGRPLAELLVDPLTGEVQPIASSPIMVLLQVGPRRRLHRPSCGADPHPHPSQEPAAERRPRTSIRLAEVRAPLPARLEIDDGHSLGVEVETYRQLLNQTRPHEGIAMRRPLDVHLEAINDRQTTKSTEPETQPTP